MITSCLNRASVGAALIGALTMASASLLAAEPKTVEEIANYKGTDRQALLESGAKKEGSLLVYTVGSQTDPMFKRFTEKYPYIRLEAYKADSTDITRRVIEEYTANKFIVDSIDLSTGGLHPLKDAGVLQPYYSSETAAYAPGTVDPDNAWVLDYLGYVGLGYNTDAVKADDVPKTWDDVMNPKWKGLMALSGRGSTMSNWVGAVIRDGGESLVRKLGQQQFKVYQVSAKAIANLVVSGEVPLSPQIFKAHMANSADKGARVKWRAIGGVYANVNAVALAKKAPHPNATMLYIDFTLSKEGQEMRLKIGNDSGRVDLATEDKPAKIYYLSEERDYDTNFEKWTTLAREVFGKPVVDPNIKDE